jgi:hypothetical protein
MVWAVTHPQEGKKRKGLNGASQQPCRIETAMESLPGRWMISSLVHVLHVGYLTTGFARQTHNYTRQIPLGKKSVGKAVFVECFLSCTWQIVCRVSCPTLGKVETKKNKKIAKKLFFLPGSPPPASACLTLGKSRHFSRATQPVGFEPATSPSRVTPSTTAPHCYLHLDSVLVPTYYTKPSVNCLFEALNEFKLKSYQQQSFITFRDIQLLFRKFLRPKLFIKFKFQIWEIQT